MPAEIDFARGYAFRRVGNRLCFRLRGGSPLRTVRTSGPNHKEIALTLRIKKGFTLIELMIVIAIIAIIAAIAIPNLIEARKNGNETAAIGALKTIGTSQSLFREADKEGDGNLDYGTLAELASAGGGSTVGLIDSVLGAGTKNGYLFSASYGAQTSEFLWFAVANPALPQTTGDRYFCANQEGVTFYTVSAAFAYNTDDCTVPANSTPVGK
ncbi:MAG: prepilin-type N-terminal cleavage/methylation domain-containing protein [Planctomycetota bacterium]|nr:MAG: prepilin-type N-terminal cleavage/methylation domain-containing protein [Planctomycetota bacterium]